MRRAEVLSRFLDSFERHYPQLAFTWMRQFPQRALGPYSLSLRVAFGKDRLGLDLVCLVLTEGYPERVHSAVRRAQEAKIELHAEALPVLVAPYFSEEARLVCREAGISFMDLAGNALIDAPQVYVEIMGKPNPFVRQRQVHTPFEGKAERITRAILLDHRRAWRIRELAEYADLSSGLVSMVTTALAEMGLLSKDRRGVTVHNPGALLDAWAEHYDLRQNPLRVFRCDADAEELRERFMAQCTDGANRLALTLWSGAYHLLHEDDEEPRRVALYWAGDLNEAAQMLRLGEEGHTYIFMFQPYDDSLLWGAGASDGCATVVHPLQLYLDLISGDREEWRLAQRLRKRLLCW